MPRHRDNESRVTSLRCVTSSAFVATTVCAVCAEGYALASEYVCSKCSRERTLHEAVSATILAVVTLSAVVLTVRYLWSHEAPAARNTSRYLTNVRKFFVKRAQKLKIVVVCWQIVSQASTHPFGLVVHHPGVCCSLQKHANSFN